MVEPLRADVVVDLGLEATFERFTAGFGSWWPAEFTWSQPDLLVDIGMEPRLDGLLTETGPHGFRLDWGRLVRWEPPHALAFLWQVGADRVPVPDPERASTVTVTFTDVEGSAGTRVAVVHDGWERHGDAAQTYREDFAPAWPWALDRLAAV